MQFDQFQVNEIDFIIKQTIFITIIPTYSDQRQYNLIQGDFGPFQPNSPIKVPLWLALHLKKSNKCKIEPPEWLDYDILNELFNKEKEQQNELQKLPNYFFELSFILLKDCSNYIKNCQKIRCLLEDIEETRKTKIDQQFSNLEKKTKLINFKHISSFEINKIRAVYQQYMQGMTNLRQNQQNIAENNFNIV